MKYIILIAIAMCSACSAPAYPEEQPLKFSVEINGVVRNDASQERIDACNKVIVEFTTQYTDHWYEAMEECVYLDADYLNEASPTISPEGDI